MTDDIDRPRGGGSAQSAVELVVPDLGRALEFYAAIGFGPVRQSGEFTALYFRGHLLFLSEDRAATSVPRWSRLRVIVGNVDEMQQRVIENGVTPVHAIDDRDGDLRSFVVVDPDGFEIRFAQTLPQ